MSYFTQERILKIMSETENQIHQLQQQQALTIQALAALLQGRAVGADSTEAFLYAIDPGLQGTLILDPPVAESQLEELPKG
jgi:hypothetical protein